MAAFDTPDQFIPTYENWVIRRGFWLPPFPMRRHYDCDREGTSRVEGPNA